MGRVTEHNNTNTNTIAYNILKAVIFLMGCVSSDSEQPGLRSNLTVATLNYCGIMNSPFEFYCDDYLTELKDIGQGYMSLLPKYFPDFNKDTWKWNMGKIDLKLRYRYSTMFQLDAGIDANNLIMSRKAFEAKWNEVFDNEIQKVKVEFNQQQREVTKKYDVLMFHTMLKYVYNILEIEDVQGKDAQKYRDKLKPFFELSFLDEQRKADKVKQNMKRVNADVFFFQQYSKNFYDVIDKTKEYYMAPDQSRDTLIIAKKSSFKQKPATTQLFLESIGEGIKSKLDWNQRSSFMIVQKYVFINAHLSSKADRNKEQIEDLKAGILELKKKVPDYEIIVAGDLNSYLKPFSNEVFNFFPLEENQMTTVKKRTVTQGQYNKANKVVKESKDKVISTLKVCEGKISYITGAQPSSNNLVPTNDHPFDHFVIVCRLEKKNAVMEVK